jgi:hypothetical protein
MCLDPDDAIARRAFELLLNELPSSAFILKDKYTVHGKCEIKLKYRQPSVVLVWKSNGKQRELTTRKEYVSIFKKWFPGFEQCVNIGKQDYYEQIVPSSKNMLCAMLNSANEIAIEICNVADVEYVIRQNTH